MTIAQSTEIQAYRLNAGGVSARMSILRMIAASSKVGNRPPSMHVADWREARHWTIGNYESCYGMLSAGGDAWYSHFGEAFRNERDCDDIMPRNRDTHTGWFCDPDQDNTARGIVASLTHGRFVAGYTLSMNDERVYFDHVYTDEQEAAQQANEHARIVAEKECEYQERFRAAQDLETHIDDSIQRLRECIALRHRECMSYVRDEIQTLIGDIRTSRDSLATDFAGVL